MVDSIAASAIGNLQLDIATKIKGIWTKDRGLIINPFYSMSKEEILRDRPERLKELWPEIVVNVAMFDTIKRSGIVDLNSDSNIFDSDPKLIGKVIDMIESGMLNTINYDVIMLAKFRIWEDSDDREKEKEG